MIVPLRESLLHDVEHAPLSVFRFLALSISLSLIMLIIVPDDGTYSSRS